MTKLPLLKKRIDNSNGEYADDAVGWHTKNNIYSATTMRMWW
jgi:hypothetical protein